MLDLMGQSSMLKIFCVVCLLGLSATTALVGDATKTSAQSPTDQNLVQLVRDGRQLSKANVKQLESALKSIPYDFPTRARLLGFYFHSSLPIFGRTTTIKARRRHILWLIENHPESSITELPEATIDPSGHELADEEGYRQAKELWLQQADKDKDNIKVLLNAAKFVELHDKTIAETLLKRAQAQADFQAGLAAYNRGDYETALQEWRPLAEQGHANAQSNLGRMYRKGQGVPQDYAVAAKWYRRAAEQGYASAQTNLGLMYSNGQGVPHDYVQAHMWFNLAASQWYKSAAADREKVEAEMTPAQIAEAERLAGEWKPKTK